MAGLVSFLVPLCLLLTAVHGFVVRSTPRQHGAAAIHSPPPTDQSYCRLTSTTSLYSSPESQEEEDAPVEDAETKAPPPPPPPQAAAPPQRRRLDPLVASLTRMDEDTINAPTTKVPLWGEVILDKSLFIFLPVALFAVLGIVSSVYVALNSQDKFVDALMDNPVLQELNTPRPSELIDDDGVCRGLCSSQQQDLEGLSNFMNSLRK